MRVERNITFTRIIYFELFLKMHAFECLNESLKVDQTWRIEIRKTCNSKKDNFDR